MTKKAILEKIQHPFDFSTEEVKWLEDMCTDFPFFQSAQILLTKAYKETEHRKFEEQLHKAAAHALSREQLRTIILSTPSDFAVSVAHSEVKLEKMTEANAPIDETAPLDSNAPTAPKESEEIWEPKHPIVQSEKSIETEKAPAPEENLNVEADQNAGSLEKARQEETISTTENTTAEKNVGVEKTDLAETSNLELEKHNTQETQAETTALEKIENDTEESETIESLLESIANEDHEASDESLAEAMAMAEISRGEDEDEDEDEDVGENVDLDVGEEDLDEDEGVDVGEGEDEGVDEDEVLYLGEALGEDEDVDEDLDVDEGDLDEDAVEDEAVGEVEETLHVVDVVETESVAGSSVDTVDDFKQTTENLNLDPAQLPDSEAGNFAQWLLDRSKKTAFGDVSAKVVSRENETQTTEKNSVEKLSSTEKKPERSAKKKKKQGKKDKERKDKISPETPIVQVDKKELEQSVIERFINEEPTLTKANTTDFEHAEMAKKSLEENEEWVTETMALVYAQQGHLKKAIKSYKLLSLKYPEKSVYFAGRIKKLEGKK